MLQGLPSCRIRELPRGVEDERHVDRDATRLQRTAALMAAYFEAAPVAFGWQRRTSGGPIDLVVGGTTLLRSESGTSDVGLQFPPGATGERLVAGWEKRGRGCG